MRAEGARTGGTVHASIAAFGLGILNLTGFAAADPQAHYFGQCRLGVAFDDVYGRLIDARDGPAWRWNWRRLEAVWEDPGFPTRFPWGKRHHR